MTESRRYSPEIELSELLYSQGTNALKGLLLTIKETPKKCKFKPSFGFCPSLSSRLKKFEILRIYGRSNAMKPYE